MKKAATYTLTAMISMAGLLGGCAGEAPPVAESAPSYFDNAGRDDVLSGGVKMVPIETPLGTFRVWTKRVGNNPTKKVLLLHGGPSATHEYFEAADSYLPGAGIEYYYYDQLGSFYSDPSDDPSLWTIEHYVDEVEQVRVALGLDSSNFYLLGHSWGGILAMEYALAHGENLKGLIISNMMASIPAYNAYAHDVLMPELQPEVLAEVEAIEAAEDYENPRYMELLTPHWYEQHILRMPAAEWPDPVNRGFAHLNYPIYLAMQGPSEMGARGSLEFWDRTGDLQNIMVPTLVIGARYDTMDPNHMEWMAGELPRGRYLYCPNGSHMAMYDDQVTYFTGLIDFIDGVDAGR
jgi:proline iminopeptidase